MIKWASLIVCLIIFCCGAINKHVEATFLFHSGLKFWNIDFFLYFDCFERNVDHPAHQETCPTAEQCGQRSQHLHLGPRGPRQDHFGRCPGRQQRVHLLQACRTAQIHGQQTWWTGLILATLCLFNGGAPFPLFWYFLIHKWLINVHVQNIWRDSKRGPTKPPQLHNIYPMNSSNLHVLPTLAILYAVYPTWFETWLWNFWAVPWKHFQPQFTQRCNLNILIGWKRSQDLKQAIRMGRVNWG